MSAFLNMGGHAAFVWPAYILTALVMAGLLIFSWRAWRHQENLLKNLHRPAGKNLSVDGED